MTPKLAALLRRAQQAEDRHRFGQMPSELRKASAIWEQILRDPALDSVGLEPRSAIYHDAMGFYLYCYRISTAPEDLRRGQVCFEHLMRELPLKAEQYPHYASHFAILLAEAYETAGKQSLLDLAIETWRLAIARTPTDSPQLCIYLHDLAIAEMRRYLGTQDCDDLETSIVTRRRVIDAAALGSAERSAGFDSLAVALWERFCRSAKLVDLDEAIAAWNMAGQVAPQQVAPVERLDRLARAIRERFQLTNEVQDLDRAIGLKRQAADQAGLISPQHAERLSALGAWLHELFEHTGDIPTLQEGISALREAIGLTAQDSPDSASRRNNLSVSLRSLFGCDADVHHLNEAVEVLRETPQSVRHPSDPSQQLYNLAAALFDRFHAFGERYDLDEAIQCSRSAIARTAALDGSDRLHSLAACLAERYRIEDRLPDLEEALSLWQEASLKASAGSPLHYRCLNGLGVGLKLRYERLGAREDLDQCLEHLRKTLEWKPQGAFARNEWAGTANNLGIALLLLYQRTGKLEDLNEAIATWRRALQATAKVAPAAAGHWHSWGLGLSELYKRTGKKTFLRSALAAFRTAVAKTTAGSPSWAGRLNSLGTVLLNLYEIENDDNLLETAIATHRDALQLTSTKLSDRAALFSGLGVALLARARARGQETDLDEAIGFLEKAYRGLSANAPILPAVLTNLANALQYRQRLVPCEEVARIEESYREAFRIARPNSNAIALTAARNWGNWAFMRRAWQDAIEAYEGAWEMSEKLFAAQLWRQDRQAWLRETQGLAAREAYARAQSGDLEGAVLALERSQARLLTATLRRQRADSAFSPARLELADILSAARQTQLVYLAVTEHGGLALVVGGDTACGLRSIWLERLCFNELQERLNEYFKVYSRWRLASADRNLRSAWSVSLAELTGWLWQVLMERLLMYLADADAAILIPTGLLVAAPLHAAWAACPTAPTGRLFALDRITLSFAPNARSLAVRANQPVAQAPTKTKGAQ